MSHYVYSDYCIKLMLVPADLDTDLPLNEWTVYKELATCSDHATANTVAASVAGYIGSLKDSDSAFNLHSPKHVAGLRFLDRPEVWVTSWKAVKVVCVNTRKTEQIIEPANHQYGRVETHLINQVSV